MATKKAASSTKKSAVKKPVAKKQATKVTTVKAVESRPARVAASSRGSFWARLNSTPLLAAVIAEFVGTFFFAAAIIAGQGQPILVFFALVGLVLAVGQLSGGYLNPALAIGGWVTRRINGVRALAYVVAQVLGAMLALVVLNAFVKGADTSSTAAMFGGAPELFKATAVPEAKEWFVLFGEALGSLVFGFAVASATRETKDRTAAAFTVGLGLFIGLMVGGSAAAIVGGSAILNPAVAFSLQAITSWNVWPIAIYIVTTIVAATLGFLLHDYLKSAERE